MAKGAAFEERALVYLKGLFEQLGFPVTEARRQRAGTQNGFDIRIGFLDDNKRERKFYFECKDYTTDISWNEIGVKILELHASSHRPDGYIALSPHVDFSNINLNLLEKLAHTVHAPVRYWTPETQVKAYFSLDVPFYQYLYGVISPLDDAGRDALQGTVRAVIIDMLRQRDELMAKRKGTAQPKELTLKIPRVHPDDIIGREDDLEELHRLLFNNQRVVVVNGLGGIGKTTLAQAYLSKHFGDYKHVAWVTQLSEDIVNDIVNAGGLAESLNVDKQGKEVGQLCQELLHQLKAIPDGPNLLILDNASTNLSAIKEILPGQPGWHVLVTSRERIEGFYPKALDFLSPEQAVELFKKHCVLIKEEGKIAELVKVVDYHTLTIEILAKTAQLRRVKVEVLKEAIKEDLRTNVYVKHKGEKIDKVRSYLASIFNLSNLTEDEVWLMKQFVCLPAEYYPYDLLVELIDPDDNMKEFFSETLAGLVEKGWLLSNSATDAYKIHVIIQEVVGRKLVLELEDVRRLMDAITSQLRIDETKDNPVEKFAWVSYGRALLDRFPNSMLPSIAVLQNNLAMVLKALGDYSGARDLQEKAVVSDEWNFGPDHPSTANSYSNLATVLQDLGDYGSARDFLKRAAVSNERSLGLNHPITATSYSNLALVLKELGDYGGARDLLEKAMVSDAQNFGADHPFTAIRYSNLALVLRELGDYGGARDLLEKAVVSAERNFGPNHPTTANRYSNMAAVLNDLGDYGGARDLLEKAMISDERNFGTDHPYTRIRYSNLAMVLRALGDYGDARGLLEKAITSDKRNFGSDHPSTAIGYLNLATVLQDLGDYATALELAAKSLTVFQNKLPEGHPHIKTAQNLYDSIKAKL